MHKAFDICLYGEPRNKVGTIYLDDRVITNLEDGQAYSFSAELVSNRVTDRMALAGFVLVPNPVLADILKPVKKPSRIVRFFSFFNPRRNS